MSLYSELVAGRDQFKSDLYMTAAEYRILILMCRGMSYDQISKDIGCTISAVKFHVTKMMKKHKHSRREELIVMAANHVIRRKHV